jgi:phage-related protein
VAEYLAGQPVRAQVILDNQIDRLNDLGPDNPHLPHPWSSHVRGDLRELRCHVGGDHHRILFARSRNLIVLLHAFPKRTAQLPEDEIRIAEERWDDFTRRMNAEPRRPPRPAGSDAPRRVRH